MTIVTNIVRARLAAGDRAIGLAVRLARTADIANLLRIAGFDWLMLDFEHGTMALDVAAQIAVAALGAGIAPLVRVPQDDYALAVRAIDGGAMGIVLPHVDTAAQAAAAVAALRYPPLGHLSAGGGMPQSGFQAVRGAEAGRMLNETILIAVMLETPLAIANAASIAAVPGVDIVMIGTNDLMMEMGLSNEPDHPRVVEAYRGLIDACAQHGKWAGMGGVHQDAALKLYLDMGARFVLTTTDLALLVGAATQRVAALRQL